MNKIKRILDKAKSKVEFKAMGARWKIEDKIKERREKQNTRYAKKLQVLKQQRERAEGQAKLINKVNKEKQRIAKAKNVIRENNPGYQFMKSVAKASTQKRTGTSKDKGVLKESFDRGKLRI